MSLGSNWLDWVRSFWKIPMRLLGTNLCINSTSSARFASRVSCCNETIQNAPKHYKMHKHMSLGSNGVDQVRSLPKIPMRVRSLKFCVNCISSARFAPSFMQSRKNPKCTQILQNEPIHDFRIQWGRSVAFVATNSDAHLWHKLVN